jgi:uncharacterized protein YciI
MTKKHFALRLLPSRPDFAQTMSDNEKRIMQEHVQYWKKYMDKGMVHVFGPVLDPKGVYGLGVVSVDSEEQLNEFINNDPAAKINKYEYYPMMAVIAGK